ncbi:uncharacterized protein LOC135374768 [Ornithodoros turicata]|uniref:uncharacterized protein LOC135374768 n=1 Tax=Ornithodoros turicata TaxID=34597 RepID=UPI003138F778
MIIETDEATPVRDPYERQMVTWTRFLAVGFAIVVLSMLLVLIGVLRMRRHEIPEATLAPPMDEMRDSDSSSIREPHDPGNQSPRPAKSGTRSTRKPGKRHTATPDLTMNTEGQDTQAAPDHDYRGARAMEKQHDSNGKICDTEDCKYMRWLLKLSVDTSKDPCANFYHFVCSGAVSKFPRDFDNVSGTMIDWISNNLTSATHKLLLETKDKLQSEPGFAKIAKVFQGCVAATGKGSAVQRSESNLAVGTFLRNIGMALTEELMFDSLDKIVELMFMGLPLVFDLAPIPYTPKKDVHFSMTEAEGIVAFKASPRRPRYVRQFETRKLVEQVFHGHRISKTTIDSIVDAQDEVREILNGSPNTTMDMETVVFIPMSQLGMFLDDESINVGWIRSLERHSQQRLPSNHMLRVSIADVVLFHRLFGNFTLSAQARRKFVAWTALVTVLGYSGLLQQDSVHERTCLMFMLRNFPLFTSSKALFNLVEQTRVDAVHTLVYNIYNEAKRSFNKSSMLDTATKRGALDKLSKLSFFIGYPLELRSAIGTNNLTINVSELSGVYAEDLLRVNTAISKTRWNLILGKGGYDVALQYVHIRSNPIYRAGVEYVSQHNSLFIPPAVMLPPAFTFGGPPEVTYGALGRYIGQEIMSGYDEFGRRFDGFGEPRGWFQGKVAYADFFKCYDKNIAASSRSWSQLGNQRQHIADALGEKTILGAYRAASRTAGVTLGEVKGLTSDQIFYASWCLSLCGRNINRTSTPYEDRCNMVLMNSHHFSHVFKCATGAPMNPKTKCEIW